MIYINDPYIHPNTAHGCITSNRVKCAASSAMKMNVSRWDSPKSDSGWAESYS